MRREIRSSNGRCLTTCVQVSTSPQGGSSHVSLACFLFDCFFKMVDSEFQLLLRDRCLPLRRKTLVNIAWMLPDSSYHSESILRKKPHPTNQSGTGTPKQIHSSRESQSWGDQDRGACLTTIPKRAPGSLPANRGQETHLLMPVYSWPLNTRHLSQSITSLPPWSPLGRKWWPHDLKWTKCKYPAC